MTTQSLPFIKQLLVLALQGLIRWVRTDFFFYSVVALFSLKEFLDITVNVLLEDDITVLDQWVVQLLNRWAVEPLTRLFLWITLLGREGIILFLILLLALFWQRGRRAEALLVLMATAGGMFWIYLFKLLLGRERPVVGTPIVQEADFSFPSGHAGISLCFYGALLYLYAVSDRPLWTKWLLGLVIAETIGLINLSRVYLGVHYPSDVLAGLYLGLFWTALCAWLYHWHVSHRAKRTETVGRG